VASDEMSFDLYQSEPGLQTKMKLNRAELNQFTQQYIANIAKNRGVADSLYTIPVVFHIIHTYGAENITDAASDERFESIELELSENRIRIQRSLLLRLSPLRPIAKFNSS
jgi:hypothetical protein